MEIEEIDKDIKLYIDQLLRINGVLNYLQNKKQEILINRIEEEKSKTEEVAE